MSTQQSSGNSAASGGKLSQIERQRQLLQQRLAELDAAALQAEVEEQSASEPASPGQSELAAEQKSAPSRPRRRPSAPPPPPVPTGPDAAPHTSEPPRQPAAPPVASVASPFPAPDEHASLEEESHELQDDHEGQDDLEQHVEEEPDDDDAAEPRRGSFVHRLLNSSPPWLVSSVFHAAALVVLALMTLAVQETERKGVSVVAAPLEETTLEQLDEIELQPQEELDIEQFNLAVTNPDPGMIQFSDLTAATAEMAANDAGDISLSDTTVGEIGELFGESGQGMAKIGEGMRAAYFFGAKSTGSRFVFVVDNSNSMGGGRFETALNELVKTVEGLGPQQKFHVIFFSDAAYRMFHPTPVDGLVAATPENKAKLRRWLYTVQMCLRTRGMEAMQAALQLNPDAIYILGDGAFTDKTGKMLTAPHNRRTVIHTVGMEVQQRGANELTAIANANKGTFRLVAARPAAKAMARQNPIKRNNTRGPVWGIDLPLVRKK